MVQPEVIEPGTVPEESDDDQPAEPTAEAVSADEDTESDPARDPRFDTDDEEPTVVEIDPDEEDVSGGLFDGVEEAGGDDSEPDDVMGDVDPDDVLGPSSDGAAALGQTINEGAARLAVIGLDDEHKIGDRENPGNCLEAEFRDVFETFRLGHFSAEVIEEHLLVDDSDVNPVWGMAASAMACAVFALMMRPDRDDLFDRADLDLGALGIPMEVSA